MDRGTVADMKSSFPCGSSMPCSHVSVRVLDRPGSSCNLRLGLTVTYDLHISTAARTVNSMDATPSRPSLVTGPPKQQGPPKQGFVLLVKRIHHTQRRFYFKWDRTGKKSEQVERKIFIPPRRLKVFTKFLCSRFLLLNIYHKDIMQIKMIARQWWSGVVTLCFS